MDSEKLSKPLFILTTLLLVMGAVGSGEARQAPAQRPRAVPPPQQVPVSSNNIPDDVQLVNAETNPSIRIPVGHSSLNWTLMKPRIRASYGWLEVDRTAVRYTTVRPSQRAKEPDTAFDIGRSEITDIKIEYGAAEFRARGLRHFFGYSPPEHWDAADSTNTSVNSIVKTDALLNPLILRALNNFDGMAADLKVKQQTTTPPTPAIQTPVAPPPAPVAAPPPPTLVIMAPSGVSQGQTLEVSESPLTIRGVAMANTGLPTITINDSPAALRPKGENVAEFWSDPINLKPGDNSFEVVATSNAKADSRFKFVAHFTPKSAPANPRALGKDEIISLLQGGVPTAHIAELVKDRGVKFTPTPADLNDLRAAGANDELIQAIQQAAPHP